MGKILITTDDILNTNGDVIVFIGNTVLPDGKDKIAEIMGVAVEAQNGDAVKAVIIDKKEKLRKPAIYISGPQWQGGNKGESEKLKECCEKCLEKCAYEGFKNVDILSIPTGIYNSQMFQVTTAMLNAIKEFFNGNSDVESVRIVCENEKAADSYMQAYNFWYADEKSVRIMNENWD